MSKKSPSTNRVKEVDDGVHLSRSHQYYYQVQSQLHILGVQFTDFVMWTEKGMYIERIMPDNDMWVKTLNEASLFFKRCILPELVGKYYTRNER